jgi:hypothetical protein
VKSDDNVSKVDNSVVLSLAAKRAGTSAELHVYASGGHGFGVRKSDQPCSTWTRCRADWLRNQGLLEPAK